MMFLLGFGTGIIVMIAVLLVIGMVSNRKFSDYDDEEDDEWETEYDAHILRDKENSI
jgi:hypothetical protein